MKVKKRLLKVDHFFSKNIKSIVYGINVSFHDIVVIYFTLIALTEE